MCSHVRRCHELVALCRILLLSYLIAIGRDGAQSVDEEFFSERRIGEVVQDCPG